MKQPFIPNHIYKRSDIHDLYGGNRQSGISPSVKYPFIFIFSGSTGKQYGYKDGWDNPNVFTYTGEGQVGDMKFVKGNLALRNHLENNKRVFLFEYHQKAYVKYICELEFYDAGFFKTHDTNNDLRDGIRFFFNRVGARIPKAYELFDEALVATEPTLQYAINLPNETERKGLVTSRVGQGVYRKRIIHRWEYQCAVTGFNKINLLIASHIVPWKDASDIERLDVNNGILLSPNYDALFDRHLISFENNGKIILSDAIESEAYHKIGVTGRETIKNLSSSNLEYINKHRELILRL